mmetsp:Transcript_6397/g.14075  ORF Transcript_6397/g.14075 Transcript_6397/m.14075 type:complete len:93 (+) Transcript_6397:62-340(+)
MPSMPEPMAKEVAPGSEGNPPVSQEEVDLIKRDEWLVPAVPPEDSQAARRQDPLSALKSMACGCCLNRRWLEAEPTSTRTRGSAEDASPKAS